MSTPKRPARGRGFRPAAVLLCVPVAATVLAACAGGGSGGGNGGGSTVSVGIVADFSGSGAADGIEWRDGVEYAISQINAGGGLLGKKVVPVTEDTESDPTTSIAAMRKVLGADPYVVMGTLESSETIVNEKLLTQAGVPQITGSGTAAITTVMKPDNLFRVDDSSDQAAESFSNYIATLVGNRRVGIIYSDDSSGSSYLDSFGPALKKAGATIATEISTEVGQSDFSGEVARLANAHVDTVFLDMHEPENGKFLREAKSSGLLPNVTYVGIATATDTETISLGGSAANGVQGFTVFDPTVPASAAMIAGYDKTHPGVNPDDNFLKGYMGMWAVAYGTRDIGAINQAKLISYLHSHVFCASKYPNLMGSTAWGQYGDMNRAGYVVEVVNGQTKVVRSLPALDAGQFAQCQG